MAMKATITVFLFLSVFELNTSFYSKHYYVDRYLSWSDAQDYCSWNRDVLSTANHTELQALSAYPRIIYSWYWIGLHRDASNPNLWRWSRGEEATNVPWAAGEPGNQQCACVLTSSSNVYDFYCKSQIPFYCMSYELIVVPQESTWEEALQYCRQNYIDLAILSSDELMREAKDRSTQALTDDVWIGLRFLAGHWFWVNGDDLGYKVWSAGGELQCPSLDQRCGVYDRTQNAWRPTDCERRLKFLCVKKPLN
ncbi:lectin BRA-3-like [Pseudorasbora parva]|uniref:lectin BRA-3-like n=1 Tax=Pseudorasbora parva TaxID=51549 RepID=UPI00351DC8F3